MTKEYLSFFTRFIIQGINPFVNLFIKIIWQFILFIIKFIKIKFFQVWKFSIGTSFPNYTNIGGVNNIRCLKIVILSVAIFFVLFNNNLIIQFGRTEGFQDNQNAATTVTFPVAYTTIYTVVNCLNPYPENWNASYNTSIYALSNTQFRSIHNRALPGFHGWISIGY